jgi:predicted nucleic acid-binding protein
VANLADRIVVDASALLPLVLSDTPERTDYAAAIIDRAAGGALALVIPQICHLELAAVVARKVRGRALSDALAQEFFEQLDGLGFELFVESFRYSELYDNAMALGCQVADAVYLTLAKDPDLSIATLDGGMRQAAKQAGIPVFEVR